MSKIELVLSAACVIFSGVLIGRLVVHLLPSLELVRHLLAQ